MTPAELDRLEALEKAATPGECDCSKPVRLADGQTGCHCHCASVRFQEKMRWREEAINAAPQLIAAAKREQSLKAALVFYASHATWDAPVTKDGVCQTAAEWDHGDIARAALSPETGAAT